MRWKMCSGGIAARAYCYFFALAFVFFFAFFAFLAIGVLFGWLGDRPGRDHDAPPLQY
jgi:hypothetical protein